MKSDPEKRILRGLSRDNEFARRARSDEPAEQPLVSNLWLLLLLLLLSISRESSDECVLSVVARVRLTFTNFAVSWFRTQSLMGF